MSKFLIDLDDTTHKKFKSTAAKKGQTMHEFAIQAIKEKIRRERK